VEDASFLKLDNATLGYNFGNLFGERLKNVRVYLSGQNLFFITNYTGVDPEVRFADDGNALIPGIDRRNTWFRTRTYTFGLNVSF
jgi:iron complex outermembrane receptor protein